MLSLGCSLATAAEPTQVDKTALDSAFTALKDLQVGQDIKVLQPIDDAVAAAHEDSALRADLEKQLSALLPSDASRMAKDYACRMLRIIGTADSVPALAALLTDKDNSHMARFALERMSAPEAAKALRDALPKVGGALKVGVIGSLGSRRDAASVPALTELLSDNDMAIARAAACALGDIGSADSAKVLLDAAKKSPEDAKPVIADAALRCAERLLADGQKPAALRVYGALSGEDQPKQVRLAAKRGMLAAAQKKD
jgi:HEAT repeat protein